jgi:hypothetical protein
MATANIENDEENSAVNQSDDAGPRTVPEPEESEDTGGEAADSHPPADDLGRSGMESPSEESEQSPLEDGEESGKTAAARAAEKAAEAAESMDESAEESEEEGGGALTYVLYALAAFVLYKVLTGNQESGPQYDTV